MILLTGGGSAPGCVCVCSGGCVSALGGSAPGGGGPGGKVLFLQASVIVLTGGCLLGGGAAGGDPPRMATAAGGTHPTGMHSCLSKVYSRIKPCCTLLTNDSRQFRRRASWNSSL